MTEKANGKSEPADSNAHEHDSASPKEGGRRALAWRLPYAWSVFATCLSGASLLIHQIKGKYWWWFTNETVFGWPFTFMARRSTWLSQIGESLNVPLFLETPEEDWIFFDYGHTYLNWPAIVGNAIVGLLVLYGVYFTVQRFCIRHELRFRFSITGILAIVVWFPVVYLMRYHPGIETIAFYLSLLEELLYAVLLVSCFGWLTIAFAGIKRLLPRST